MARSSSTSGTPTTAALAEAARAGASGDAAAHAFAELAAMLGEIEAGYIGPDRRMHTPEDRAAGRYLVANALQHGFQCWFDSDPKRPLFQRWLSPTKKLLGDNPDAVYYGAVTDPAGAYRIRGNVHGAAYTSFTVETGAQDGHLSKGVISTLNDTEFDIAADGSFEIIASPEPQPVARLGLGARDDLEAAVRGDVELRVVQGRNQALREMAVLGPGLDGERSVGGALDVAANAVAARGIGHGAVVDGIGVVPEKLLGRAQPAVKDRALGIRVEPALEAVLKRIRDQVAAGGPIFGRVHAAIGTDVARLDLAEHRSQLGEGACRRVPRPRCLRGPGERRGWGGFGHGADSTTTCAREKALLLATTHSRWWFCRIASLRPSPRSTP